MQDPRSSSTLELVVNEQQIQLNNNNNMSQIDLRPSPADINQQTTTRLNDYLAQQQQQQQQQEHANNMQFGFDELKSWPSRFRDNFILKLDEAKARSETRTDYVIEVIQAFSGIVIWVLCFTCTIIVPIVLFFLALANLDNCNDRPSLPYLVFAIGFFMTASNLFNLALALDIPVLANHQFLSSDVKNIIASIVNILFNALVAFLYLLTAYMVYNIKGRPNKTSITQSNKQRLAILNNETSGENFYSSGGAGSEEAIKTNEGPDSGQSDVINAAVKCSASLYNFTFWFITLTLGSFALLSLLATLLFIYNRYRLAIIRGSTPRSHQATNSTGVVNNGANLP